MRTLSLLALVSFTVACGGDDKTTPDEETAAPVGPTDNDGDGVPDVVQVTETATVRAHKGRP